MQTWIKVYEKYNLIKKVLTPIFLLLANNLAPILFVGGIKFKKNIALHGDNSSIFVQFEPSSSCFFPESRNVNQLCIFPLLCWISSSHFRLRSSPCFRQQLCTKDIRNPIEDSYLACLSIQFKFPRISSTLTFPI